MRTGLAAIVISCGHRETLTSCGAVVSDSNISDFGRIGYTYSAGVAVAGVGVTVEHNRIQRGYHLGTVLAF
jgi:hypothetical protein